MKHLFAQRKWLSSSLLRFGLSADNTLLSALVADNERSCGRTPSKQLPRQSSKSHFTYVCPEPVTAPKLVYISQSVVELIGVGSLDNHSDNFVAAFSGNSFLPGLDSGYATVYGCHSHGQWLGQLGDGRAISVGEVLSPLDKKRYELQLKGAGRTPYSRGYDGRAVLRSSIREALASEAMFHLGVGTTRALSVIATDDKVSRRWYGPPGGTSSDVMQHSRTPHPPAATMQETVAVLCRVASSFFRFSHIELFAKRKDNSLLVQLVDHIIAREYPHLLVVSSGASSRKPEVYVEMYREVVGKSMKLVSEWMRVGYCQGNMNSDNTHIAGLTIDYGPFGWMERFSPAYQPFTSDTSGRFSFQHQPAAMKVNLETLAEAMGEAVRAACEEAGSEVYSPADVINYVDNIDSIAKHDVMREYTNNYEQMVMGKLGLGGEFREEMHELWVSLETLMTAAEADYAILFRALGQVVACSASGEEALALIWPAMCDVGVGVEVEVEARGSDGVAGTSAAGGGGAGVICKEAWVSWLDAYATCRARDMSRLTPQARAARMNERNPKYILRNWMAAMAYQEAEDTGEYHLMREISVLLERPYDEGSEEMEARWCRRTPPWAVGMPGVSFLS